jgi:hypothetical protein
MRKRHVNYQKNPQNKSDYKKISSLHPIHPKIRSIWCKIPKKPDVRTEPSVKIPSIPLYEREMTMGSPIWQGEEGV